MPASKKIDPSKFDRKVTFLKETAIPDEYGGTDISFIPVLETWAAKQESKTSLSYNDALSLQAGQTLMVKDIELKIRYRRGFIPSKDMHFDIDGKRYMVTNPVTEIGDPVQYYYIAGKRVD